MRLLYVVTYDICDDRRLRQVFQTMLGYGDHMQYSVFRCELSDRERAELMGKLTEIIKHDEDQVLLFPLGPASGMRETAVHYVGLAYRPSEHEAVVI